MEIERMQDPVEVFCEIVAETKFALRVVQGDAPIWVPRSQVYIHQDGVEVGDVVDITMPEWLAVEKGFV